MPRFEKVSGGAVYLRGIDERVSVGDAVDVIDGFAEFLEERGDFKRVEELEEATVSEDDIGDALEEADHTDAESAIEDGVCPWCDEYEGDGLPQHASAAHPDEWAEYTED